MKRVLGRVKNRTADRQVDRPTNQQTDRQNDRRAKKQTGKPKFQVSSTKPPKGQEKISEEAFAQLRAELNSRPDKKQIMDNFKNKFYPSVNKLLANHIELTIHEEFLREQMTKSTEQK